LYHYVAFTKGLNGLNNRFGEQWFLDSTDYDPSTYAIFMTILEWEAKMFMHTFIDEIEYENNMVILFEIIGHIGFIRLKAKDTSNQNKGSHCKYFINSWYVCKIVNTYHIIYIVTNNHNNHLPIIYSATSPFFFPMAPSSFIRVLTSKP